jgi:hypothetical protein
MTGFIVFGSFSGAMRTLKKSGELILYSLPTTPIYLQKVHYFSYNENEFLKSN